MKIRNDFFSLKITIVGLNIKMDIINKFSIINRTDKLFNRLKSNNDFFFFPDQHTCNFISEIKSSSTENNFSRF